MSRDLRKKVLVLCTGNSCRSIIAEAILNAELGERLVAYSSGVAPSGRVMPEALQVLREAGVSVDGLHSKKLETLKHIDFDLVVTVCDHAHETCPVFPGNVKKLHISLPDPLGRGPEAFEDTVRRVTDEVLPAVVESVLD